MSKNIIAVVTPVYNGEKTIGSSINSLLSQTFNDWVSIIVNDGSTDNTKDVLKKYLHDDRFIIINLEENKGRPFARNIALEKVKDINAKYMCMLDADDLYYPNKLEWQYDYMEKNPDLTLMSCSLGYINENYQLIGVLDSYSEEKIYHFKDFVKYKGVPHASSIIRAKDIEDTKFDLKMTFGEDQDFMRRILINRKYSFIPKIGYLYNRVDSFTIKKYKKSLKLGVYSSKKQGFNSATIFKLIIINQFKLLYIRILFLIGKENIYFKKIGRKPTKSELIYHNSTLTIKP